MVSSSVHFIGKVARGKTIDHVATSIVLEVAWERAHQGDSDGMFAIAGGRMESLKISATSGTARSHQ